MKRLTALFILLLCPLAHTKSNRVTSVYISQKFINDELRAHVKPGLLRDLNIELAPNSGDMFLRGIVQVPVEELRAVNLDPKLGAFRFQLTIRPEATKEGFLILEFPLNETYFYPVVSKDPARDRVVVPVQMLSLALASARGYFAALSGDFTNFDRKTAKIKALLKAVNLAIANEKNTDALEVMKTERESLKLQLAAIPIERKQLQAVSKEVEGLLGFTGEKEINLNDKFAARQNALIVKLDLGKITPYLKGVELGGIHMVHDKHDGPTGENYFSIDIDAVQSETASAEVQHQSSSSPDDDDGLEVPPSAIIRINQSLLESEMIVQAEKKAMGSKLKDLKIELREDGLHVSGKYHRFFFNIPFDTIVDLETTSLDTFEIRIRDIEIAGLDLEFLTGFVLESMQNRLDQSLHGICQFEYIGEHRDHSRALRVRMNPAKLMPAIPDIHLVDVDVRDKEFLFKVGKRASN